MDKCKLCNQIIKICDKCFEEICFCVSSALAYDLCFCDCCHVENPGGQNQ